MSTNKDKRRVRNVRIDRDYIIGNEAWQLSDADRAKDPKIPSNHKFRWRLYLKNREGGADISFWLEKVQFKLHDDYKPNNLRMIENPPFEITETGYGSFFIDVRLFFRQIAGERPIWRHGIHYLNLEPLAPTVEGGPPPQKHCVSDTLDIIWINEPTEQLYNELISERQWDYIEREKAAASGSGKGRGKGKAFKPLPAGQVAKDSFGRERTNELPERATDSNPFSREAVQSLLDIAAKAEQQVNEQLKKLQLQRERNDEEMKELTASGDLKKKK